ncbi:unnamed protein product [Ectocarpus sp. 6 AP-2014]
MAERVTRSGRTVKCVHRYAPEEVNLVDDFSDGSFDDSEFDGTMDGMSEGSHVANSDTSDDSYVDVSDGGDADNSAESEGGSDLETDDDSVITEHVPEEEIIDIPSESEEDSEPSCESEDSTEDDCSSSSSAASLPIVRHVWKKHKKSRH